METRLNEILDSIAEYRAGCMTIEELQEDLETILQDFEDEIHADAFDAGLHSAQQDAEELAYDRGYEAALREHGITEETSVVE